MHGQMMRVIRSMYLSAEDLKVLEQETDAKGRKIRVHKMLIPKKPVCITEKELAGYVFEEGEDTREAGERLAASYVNFYIGNKVVLVPQFGDEHDVLATDLLQKLFPEREIVPIFAKGDHHRRWQYPLHYTADTGTQMTDSRKSYKVSLQDRWKDKNAGFQNKQE